VCGRVSCEFRSQKILFLSEGNQPWHKSNGDLSSADGTHCCRHYSVGQDGASVQVTVNVMAGEMKKELTADFLSAFE
jgi:hypothetical protein